MRLLALLAGSILCGAVSLAASEPLLQGWVAVQTGSSSNSTKLVAQILNVSPQNRFLNLLLVRLKDTQGFIYPPTDYDVGGSLGTSIDMLLPGEVLWVSWEFDSPLRGRPAELIVEFSNWDPAAYPQYFTVLDTPVPDSSMLKMSIPYLNKDQPAVFCKLDWNLAEPLRDASKETIAFIVAVRNTSSSSTVSFSDERLLLPVLKDTKGRIARFLPNSYSFFASLPEQLRPGETVNVECTVDTTSLEPPFFFILRRGLFIDESEEIAWLLWRDPSGY